MNKQLLLWYYLTLKSEIKHKKIKSIVKLFTNKCYRNDIKRLANKLHGKKYEIQLAQIPLKAIKFSHSITYSEWVLTLMMEIKTGTNQFCETLRPIKVIKEDDGYMVIDGNHRLMALKLSYPADHPVIVRILTPVN